MALSFSITTATRTYIADALTDAATKRPKPFARNTVSEITRPIKTTCPADLPEPDTLPLWVVINITTSEPPLRPNLGHWTGSCIPRRTS